MPQPTSMPASSRICRGAMRPLRPSRTARRPVRSIRAAPWRRTACRSSARPRRSSSAGTPAGPCRRPCAISSIALSSAIAAGGLARRAHEQRRAGVEPDRVVRRRDRRAGIERVRGVGGRFEEVVEGAGRGPGVVARVPSACRRASVPMRSVCRVGRAMPDGAEHLLAAQHQLDRPADQTGRHDAQDLRPLD